MTNQLGHKRNEAGSQVAADSRSELITYEVLMNFHNGFYSDIYSDIYRDFSEVDRRLSNQFVGLFFIGKNCESELFTVFLLITSDAWA